MDSVEIIGIGASLVVGLASGVAIWWLLRALSTDDLVQEDHWRYDVTRINSLRKLDTFFRVFQVPIQILARFNRNVVRKSLPEIARQIQAAGMSRFWLPEEYLAKLQVMSLLMAPLYVYLCFSMLGGLGIFSGLMLSLFTLWMLRIGLRRKAERRLVEIKRRLPFLLDLMTLLMEAGSSFLQSLSQATKEFSGHPTAIEFSRVLSDMNMGKARVEAFDAMRKRLHDDEVNGIVAAILQSEELGTPISTIFRTQADVLRLKRSQRAEKIAGEAGVNMLLPGVLIMLSTVLLILGPFVVNHIIGGLRL